MRNSEQQTVQLSFSQATLNRCLNEAARVPRLIRAFSVVLLNDDVVELDVCIGVNKLLAKNIKIVFELIECVHDYSRSEVVIAPRDNSIALMLDLIVKLLPQYEKRGDCYAFNMRPALIRLLSGSRMFGRPLLDVIKINAAEVSRGEVTIFAELTT